MKSNLFWIEGPWPGRLGIAARPRGGDWLDDEADAWRRAGVDYVVSLLETPEITHFDLQLEASSTAAHGLQFLSQPIPDRGVPNSIENIERLASELTTVLGRGKNVVIHCRQGIGRSSLVAAAVLIVGGFTPEQAIDAISRSRGVPVPETDAQRKWISGFAVAQGR